MRKILAALGKGFINLLKREESFHPKVSRTEATGISLAVLFIGCWILFHADYWWPGSILVVWFSLIVRQYLRNRWYELIITTAIYLFLFFSLWIQLDWNLLMPVLLGTTAFILLLRELLVFRPLSVAEELEEEKLEREEDQQS